MGVAACIDGVVLAEGDATISVFDRGFLYGDSVFEVLRTYGGKPYAEDEHLARLEASAARVFIDMPVERPTLVKQIAATLEAAGNEESYVRVVVTRGKGPMRLVPDADDRGTTVVLASPLPTPPAALYTEGVNVAFVRHARPAHSTRAAGAKASNYLANMLATREAQERGAYEAVLVEPSGLVLEGATSNIFVVKDRVLRTPSLGLGILGGITRRTIIDAAAEEGLEVHESELYPADLYEADEAFLTSSIREVVPIVRADGRAIAGGAPGPLVRQLHAGFRRHVARALGLDAAAWVARLAFAQP